MRALLLAAIVTLFPAPSAVAQTGPSVDQPVVAGDWITACDATLRCMARSLPAEGVSEGPIDLSVRISRDYAPGSNISLELALTSAEGRLPEGSGFRLLIDGQELTETQAWRGRVQSLEGSAAMTFIVELQGGLELSVADGERRVLAAASLAGLQEVLARMDTLQRRDGTGDALILRGHGIADRSRVGPRTPGRSIRLGVRAGLDPPSTPSGSLVARLTQEVDCPRPSSVRLDPGTTMVLITSECGGYGRQAALVLIGEDGEIVPIRFETFSVGDRPVAVPVEPGGEVLLPDAVWEDSSQMLWVERKDRAYGDCGDTRQYAWDSEEKRFRLAVYASMPVCRGVHEFIVTYVAELAFPPSETPLEGLLCDPDLTGLDWGVCHDAGLRDLAVKIEARQRNVGQNLGRATGDALFADWRLLLDDLRQAVGGRWLDSAGEDVAKDLDRRLTFLSLIDRRDGVEGYWGNHRVSITVSSEQGRIVFEVRSPGCAFTLSNGSPGMIERSGDLLRLTVRRADFEREYPSLVGCFPIDEGASLVDGLYFALTAEAD